MTMRYTHLSVDYKRDAVAKLPSFVKIDPQSQQISPTRRNRQSCEYPQVVESSPMVGVAQLVERWIVAPVAEGSIPFAHPLTL